MNASSRDAWTDAVHWTLWGILVALFLAWPLTHLEAYAHNNDEGLYVQRAALANAGCPLYGEILFNKPPLMVWILRLAFYLGGQTLTTARVACLSICLMGFVAEAVVVRQLWGRWAALISAYLLLGLPEMPVRAHGVTSDLPAMSLALTALGAALLFRRNGHRFWIALSGSAYTGALLVNPLLIYVALPLGLILFLPDLGRTIDGHTSRRTSWLDLVLFGSICIGLGASVLAVIDRQAFFTWVIRSNYTAVGSDVALESEGIIEYLVDR
jgi:4-amino-4-deoxy-L-arabinose transferase-like glycosyltransferase